MNFYRANTYFKHDTLYSYNNSYMNIKLTCPGWTQCDVQVFYILNASSLANKNGRQVRDLIQYVDSSVDSEQAILTDECYMYVFTYNLYSPIFARPAPRVRAQCN